MDISFYGATQEVTGSCFLLRVGGQRILVECGLIQGSSEHERHNRDPFPFAPREIDAVVLTHAHLDHSGRLPLLVKQGYAGAIFTHRATVDLCAIMLEDAAYLNEKFAERENRRNPNEDQAEITPLYTRDDARATQNLFVPMEYGVRTEIGKGVWLTLRDAGHILGSATAELDLSEGDQRRKLVFSGDLGHRGAPILRDPQPVEEADLVVMESTYGDRLHRPWEATWQEMGEILSGAKSGQGNILVPAFTVGRTQELLYVFSRHFEEWGLGDWRIFLDSPMAIKATEVYDHHARVYDERARQWHAGSREPFQLPNLTLSQTGDDSMQINEIHSGAIVIAGSGMCTGGRIMHHLKRNLWRENAHVMIVGFQARGTLGRALVDGAKNIRLWGEEIEVKAHIHTVGGLSAHADQEGLVQWYRQIKGRPHVVLVHGEPEAMNQLEQRLVSELQAKVSQAVFRQTMAL
ncbi:MAG: MBL fold metallo-hydrolase [Gammaproteobacteria bacterium]|nr:MBL fold metallo-hydrolase [Gammaproteobacteria bacterium]